MSHLIAWDIETCPQPSGEMTRQQTARYEKELRRQLGRSPEMDEQDASRLVRSVHPMLCWICCISVCRYDAEREDMRPAHSYTAFTPAEEAAMLGRFWTDIQKLPGMVTWVTFNGKRFDVPILRARTLAGGMRLGRRDILSTHRYRHKPHADLYCAFDRMSLADVCDLLDVPTPKGQMEGSAVWPAVQAGRYDEVIRYCEGDVQATLGCYLKAHTALVEG